MKNLSKRKKNNIIIGGLLAIVLVMAVGYAAFATRLQINSSSSINSSWDVEITDITAHARTGAVDNTGSPSYDNTHGLTASFSTKLYSPGDYVTYKIEVTNKGSLNAVLSSITPSNNSNQDIDFKINQDQSGTAIEGALGANGVLNATGDSNNLDVGYVYVTVLYKDYEGQTSPTGAAATANFTVTLDFEQSTSAATPPTPALTIDQTFVPQYYEYHTYASGNVTIGSSYDTSSWTTDPTTLERTYYLGHDVDSTTGNVTANYACFILDNTQYCMRGKDGSNGTNYFTQNKALLGTLKDATPPAITCSTFSDSHVLCSGGGLGSLHAGSDGYVYAGVSYSVYCTAGSYGSANCTE